MDANGKNRKYKGVLGVIAGAFLLIFGICQIAYAIDFLSIFGIYISTEAVRAITLSLILFGTIFFYPASKRQARDKLPWYDAVLMVAALVPGFYFAIRLDSLLVRFGLANNFEVVLGIITILLIIEGLRRTLGWVLVCLVGFFLLYSLYGNYFPGTLRVTGHSVEDLVGYLYLSDMAVYGLAMNVFINYIFVFLLFATFLRLSGAANFFIRLSTTLVGATTGGPAKVAVIASSLFGTFSGSAVANVMGTGVITIPIMKKMGFRPQVAGAVEGAASTGGQLMPPMMGVAAFVIADFLEVPYINVCYWALIPALLYYLSLFSSVHIEAASTGLKGMPKEEIPLFREVIKEGWFYLFPLVLIIVFLGVLHYTVLRTGIYATVATIALSWLSKDKENRIGIKKLPQAIKEASLLGVDMGSLFGGVGLIIGCVGITGIALRLSSQLLALAMGVPFLIFLFLAIICLILGMGLGSLPSYVLLAVIVGPVLKKINMDVVPGHLFIFYFAVVGMITPPVCFAAFAGALLAGAPPFATGFTAMRLGVVAFLVPFVFVFDNGLLLIGTSVAITLAIATTTLGIILITVALNGYFIKRINWLIRFLFILVGFALLVPGVKVYTLPVGIVILALIYYWQRKTVKQYVLT